jgi:hypothetical protein
MNTKNLAVIKIGYRKFVMELPDACKVMEALRGVEEVETKNIKDDNGNYQSIMYLVESPNPIEIHSLTEGEYLKLKLTDGDKL